MTHPRVGLGICLLKDGKVLFGKRRNSHGDGSWCFPGGHLELNETFEQCARREVLEETNLKIKNIRFATITNDVFEGEGKHYVTIYMLADYDSGELTNMEPHKCEKWEWFDWDSPPNPLFLCQQNLIKSGFNPFDQIWK